MSHSYSYKYIYGGEGGFCSTAHLPKRRKCLATTQRTIELSSELTAADAATGLTDRRTNPKCRIACPLSSSFSYLTSELLILLVGSARCPLNVMV